MSRVCATCGKPIHSMMAPHKALERPVKTWYCTMICKYEAEKEEED
jgi:hypothetical protein